MKLPNVTQCSSSSWYHEIFYEKADPRIRDRWLMGDPLQIICLYAFYIVFIQYILPRFMCNRKPYNIDKASAVLNFMLFICCVFFFFQGSKLWIHMYDWRCEPIDESDSKFALYIVNISYYFLISKFLYTFESVLLGLRKNYSNTATYLLIHHTSYPMIIWAIINYFPGGHGTFAGFINSFTHMILFGFRLIFVNLFPHTPLYAYRRVIGLWLFMLQFAAIFIHTFQLFIWNDCGFPIAYAYFVCVYITIITILLVTMVVPQL